MYKTVWCMNSETVNAVNLSLISHAASAVYPGIKVGHPRIKI